MARYESTGEVRSPLNGEFFLRWHCSDRYAQRDIEQCANEDAFHRNGSVRVIMRRIPDEHLVCGPSIWPKEYE